MITRRHRSFHGFTLIEVLITMMLMALILPAAMKGASIAMAAASSARHRTEAATLATAKLNELLTLNEWNASQQGNFASQQHPEYNWSTQSASRDYGIYDVALTVTWKEAGVERKYVLSTLMYDATSAGGL